MPKEITEHHDFLRQHDRVGKASCAIKIPAGTDAKAFHEKPEIKAALRRGMILDGLATGMDDKNIHSGEAYHKVHAEMAEMEQRYSITFKSYTLLRLRPRHLGGGKKEPEDSPFTQIIHPEQKGEEGKEGGEAQDKKRPRDKDLDAMD